MTIQNEDDFHHLQQKLKDQEEIFNSFKLKELLQNLEHDRFHLMGIIRRNGNLANELKNLEDKLPNEMINQIMLYNSHPLTHILTMDVDHQI